MKYIVLITAFILIIISLLALKSVQSTTPPTKPIASIPLKVERNDVEQNEIEADIEKIAPLELNIKQEIARLLAFEDESFSEALTNPDVESWPLFVHPQGEYKIRYHPNLKPKVLEPVECELKQVVFEPIIKKENENFNSKFGKDSSSRESNNRNNPFEMSLFKWAYGGGSWCYHAQCTPITTANSGLMAFSSHDSFNTTGMSESPSFNEMVGLEEVVLQAIYPLPKCGLYVQSSYFSMEQREVIRLMLATLEYTYGK